jgi:chorismate mutase
MPVRGVRGATTVAANEAAAIADGTVELLRVLVERNGIRPEDIASATFTVTDDLDGEFPATSAPGALGRCIRVLIHWNTERSQGDVRHAFLRGARALRPSWAVRVPGDEGGP